LEQDRVLCKDRMLAVETALGRDCFYVACARLSPKKCAEK
jgi:hypothetical protein